MTVARFINAKEFLDACRVFLEANETANTLILGLADSLLKSRLAVEEPPLFAAALDPQHQPILCALMTPPYPLLVHAEGEFGDAMDLFQAYLVAEHIAIPGVNGQMAVSDCFAKKWCALSGKTASIETELRAYELDRVIFPAMPRGTFRQAGSEDAPVIIALYFAMHAEIMSPHDPQPKEANITAMIDRGDIYIWDVAGTPVAMAHKGRSTRHGRTVSGVYTLPAARKQGYASALVARLSQVILDEGYQVANLFTDLSNPTSNAIYQAIGYRQVCDYHRYRFE